MSDRSKIEWTDASWNPLRASLRLGAAQQIGWHCEHVTEACRNCYAEAINRRLGTRLDFKPGNRAALDLFLDEKTLLQPLHWKKPRKIFPCSMTDLFGEWVTDEQLDRIFAVMALCPQHTFIVLTKRPERMREYLRASATEICRRITDAAGASAYFTADDLATLWPLPNVWLLVSICDQPDADKFIPILLDTPAAVRGVSYEPALGPVTFAPKADASYQRLSEWYGPEGFDPTGSQPRRERRDDLFPKLDWVICGGESGPHARPMDPKWARDVRDECAKAGVAFFHKQNGEWLHRDEMPSEEQEHHELAENFIGDFVRIGKKRAGRLLDGVEHNGFPA